MRSLVRALFEGTAGQIGEIEDVRFSSGPEITGDG